jgi:hypothetical protein
MENKKLRNILIGLVVAGVLVLVVVIILNKKDNSVVSTTPEKESAEAKAVREDFETTYQNVTGTVTSVDFGALEVLLENGNKLSLKIPDKNVSFLSPIEQENGEILLENIGLFDIPQDQLVDIQYNTRTNEVMLVVVSN